MYTETHKDTSRCGSKLKEDACSMAQEAGQKIRTCLHDANDNIHQATQRVTEEIRAKPIQSGLIALGAGFILGLLFRRS